MTDERTWAGGGRTNWRVVVAGTIFVLSPWALLVAGLILFS